MFYIGIINKYTFYQYLPAAQYSLALGSHGRPMTSWVHVTTLVR